MKLLHIITIFHFVGISLRYIKAWETNKVSSQQVQYNDEHINLSRILRSPYPMYLDIMLVMEETACKVFYSTLHGNVSYIKAIVVEASKIFGMHNIGFYVRTTEYWCSHNKAGARNVLDVDVYSKYFNQKGYGYDAYVVFSNNKGGPYKGVALMHGIRDNMPTAVVDIGGVYNFDVQMVATAMVHELGHLLGFDHMDNTQCHCAYPDKKYCIMHSQPEKWTGDFPPTFDDCLIEQLIKDLPYVPSLLEPIDHRGRSYGVCGDSVVDAGEDCDCASMHLCFNLTNQGACCNPKTCKFLKSRYQCVEGDCCKNCIYKTNTLCRKKKGKCDLPDFCDGTSHLCKTNNVMQNYYSCNKNKGFCYDGTCLNLDYLCKFAYNLEKAFFSEKCAKRLRFLMSTKCPSPTTDNDFNSLICSSEPYVCNHLVCTVPLNTWVGNRHSFKSGNESCIVARSSRETGIPFDAPNYMPCAWHPGGKKSYCINNVCTNSNVANNCKAGRCNEMNTDFPITLNPKHPVIYHQLVYVTSTTATTNTSTKATTPTSTKATTTITVKTITPVRQPERERICDAKCGAIIIMAIVPLLIAIAAVAFLWITKRNSRKRTRTP